MTTITLLDFLQTEPFSFTLRETAEIMDEELRKTPKDMDTKLIDLCVDILDREYSAKFKKNTKKECFK